MTVFVVGSVQNHHECACLDIAFDLISCPFSVVLESPTIVVCSFTEFRIIDCGMSLIQGELAM